jgi:16S rRNA (guanine527-N7)-methyltransferase
MQLSETRIVELLKPFLAIGAKPADSLSPGQLKYISMYIDILLQWNERINLTAVREPEEMVTRHFGESIFAARLLFPKDVTPDSSGKALHVIDVGSGAGFPGLPIKIWSPEIHLTLIESNQKKATFLREAVRRLALENVDVFCGRAESFSGPKGDVVTLRAVERFEMVLPVAGGLVAAPGRLAIMVGAAQSGRVRELAPGLVWDTPVALPLSSQRNFLIGSKNQVYNLSR